MTERPIIMSAWSINAILATRKTQTRRVIKPQPEFTGGFLLWQGQRWGGVNMARGCRYGDRGDRLWIKEVHGVDNEGAVQYRASFDGPDANPAERGFKWRSPFYMTRELARIVLEIENVHVQPIQAITPDDAQAEGFSEAYASFALSQFKETWDRLNGPRGFGWEHDPWVWAITFRVCEAPV